MDRKVDQGESHWLLLMGAMIGNKTILADAAKRLGSDDVPEQYRELWSALKVQNVESIKAALHRLGVEQNGDTAAASIVRTLQVRTLDNYVRACVERAKLSGLLGADKAAEFFEKMSVQIRARQEAMK